MSKIEDSLLELLGNYVGQAVTLDADADFVSGFGLESIQVMEFVMEVEEKFDIAIDLDTLSNVRTVRGLSAVVGKLIGQASA